MHGEHASSLWPEICVSSSNSNDLLSVASLAAWVEWRADLLGVEPLGEIEPSKILWTWRSNQAMENGLARTQALLKALHTYGLVDMQLELDECLVRCLRPNLSRKVVLSFHGNYQGVDSFLQLLNRMRQYPHVRFWKIAINFTEVSTQEISTCLRLLCDLPGTWRQRIIFIPIGERFYPWRVMACQNLAPFLFCSARESTATAQGQMSIQCARFLLTGQPPKRNFGLLGNPVRQSISHLSHNYLLRKLNISASYLKFAAEEHEVEEILKVAPNYGLTGFSVTMPYKQKAFELASSKSEEARLSGAANTLTWQNGQWHADNTDMKAFKHIFAKLRLDASKRILILGAGGSSRSAIAAALSIKSMIYLINRSQQRAQELCDEFSVHLAKAQEINREFLSSIDVLIQATSLGLNDQAQYPFALGDLSNHTTVIDLVNATNTDDEDANSFKPTPLLEYAQKQGNPTVDAREFFFRQASYQLHAWLQLDSQVIYSELSSYV